MKKNLIYKVIWNDVEVGEISGISQDMWHINGKWTAFHRGLAIEFENKVKAFDLTLLKTNPESTLPVILQNIAEPKSKLYCLAILLDGQQLGLRQLTAKEPLDLFFPDR